MQLRCNLSCNEVNPQLGRRGLASRNRSAATSSMKRFAWTLVVGGFAIVAFTAQAPSSVLQTAQLDVHPIPTGSPVSSNIMGAAITNRLDLTRSNLTAALSIAGITMSRFPGGETADYYNWRTNTDGPGACASPSGTPAPSSTFANYMTDFAAHLSSPAVSNVQVNYGTNSACTGGGDPKLAASWVLAATTTPGYIRSQFWTVGNEQYYENAHNSIDMHTGTNCPGTSLCYAANERSFYTDMHAAAAYPIDVCVDGNPQNALPEGAAWDANVLREASYDCVEVHLYAQRPGRESDSFLLYSGPAQFTRLIDTEKARLATAGKSNTPIFVGEAGSVATKPGKQTESIVNALYAGMIIGEAANDGVAAMTWHIAYGSCNHTTGNFSDSLYGWQDYGDAGIFSYKNANCSGQPARGTIQASGNAFVVASNFIRNGEHALSYTLTGDPKLRAYASTYNGGYAIMLFNLDGSRQAAVTITIDGKVAGRRNAHCDLR